MRGEESRNTERERRGDGEKSKAKQKEGSANSGCSRQTVRWMGEESEEEKRMIVGIEMMNLLVGKPFKGDAGLSAAPVESMVIEGDGAAVQSGHMVTGAGQSMRVHRCLQ